MTWRRGVQLVINLRLEKRDYTGTGSEPEHGVATRPPSAAVPSHVTLLSHAHGSTSNAQDVRPEHIKETRTDMSLAASKTQLPTCTKDDQ